MFTLVGQQVMWTFVAVDAHFPRSIFVLKSWFCWMIVDHFSRQGSTVNLCALDLRKAFDKMNHHGLFITLMKRMVPINLLRTLEYWFSMCFTCVRWRNTFSNFFKINCGVRQGGVLSAYFFALYIDDIIKCRRTIVRGTNTSASCRSCIERLALFF